MEQQASWIQRAFSVSGDGVSCFAVGAKRQKQDEKCDDNYSTGSMMMKSAASFSNLSFPNYTNINDLEPCTTRLHNMETLFGDYSAQILLLLQDAANLKYFQDKLNCGEKDIFRHGLKVNTNKQLVKIFQPRFPRASLNGEFARDCGLFAANAVWLIKHGATMSAKLNNQDQVLDVCRPVFEETLCSLPNLKLIIALGKPAYESLKKYLELKEEWESIIQLRKPAAGSIFGKKYMVFASYHPAARNPVGKITSTELAELLAAINAWDPEAEPSLK